ncbi:YdcF family protein [Candidatus Saccharibacteria bacterium]|nr:YdcF family protein [Candidatus Saccharibacteria bacterium]MCL1962726.1 YdcF family protein [Candidatus Saccharibacteria bacterium]
MNISDQDWQNLQVIWDYLRVESDMPKHADVAVIGGCGVITVGAERAAELYKNGVVKYIIASGFADPNSSCPERTEADMLAEVLRRNGVPDSTILREPEASDTGKNITKSIEILHRKNIKPRRVILVHKPYMTRRFLATALAQWTEPQPEFFVTSKNIAFRDLYELYEKTDKLGGANMIRLMLGDYERIKTYPQFGWSVEQPFSETAERAYQELLKSGYQGKVIKK